MPLRPGRFRGSASLLNKVVLCVPSSQPSQIRGTELRNHIRLVANFRIHRAPFSYTYSSRGALNVCSKTLLSRMFRSWVPSSMSHPSVCLMKGPQPHPKQILRTVRSSASYEERRPTRCNNYMFNLFIVKHNVLSVDKTQRLLSRVKPTIPARRRINHKGTEVQPPLTRRRSGRPTSLQKSK